MTERGRSLVLYFLVQNNFVLISIRGLPATAQLTHMVEQTPLNSNHDYGSLPSTYKNMLTRLEQGDYLIQNPICSLLKIKFPKPVYKHSSERSTLMNEYVFGANILESLTTGMYQDSRSYIVSTYRTHVTKLKAIRDGLLLKSEGYIHIWLDPIGVISVLRIMLLAYSR